MSTRLSLALLLLTFAGCIDGSTPVNVGVLEGAPDSTHSTVEVVPSTGVLADGVSVARVKVTVRDSGDRVLAGQAVSFTATGSENTLVQPPATDATGLAQGTIASTRAETKTLTVKVGSGAQAVELAAHPQVTFVAGNGSRLVFVTQPPGSTRAGDTFAPGVQLQVKDEQGNVVVTPLSVTLTLEPAASGATLGGTVTRDTQDGSVSFDDLFVTQAGTGYTLRASGPGLIPAVSEPFDILAGPADPTRTLVGVSKSTVVADGTDSTVITVTVRDSYDNPVPGQSVGVTSTGTGNTLTPGSGTTDGSGTFSATLSSTVAEAKTIQATVNTVLAQAQVQVMFIAGPAVKLAFVTQPPAQTVAGQTIGPSIQVEALDALGNRVVSASLNVTLALEPVASGATLGGTAVRPVASGVANFNDLSIQKAGTGYTLRATAMGLSDAVSSPFDIVADTPSLPQTTVVVTKSPVIADGVDSTSIIVTVEDAFGNPVEGQTVGITVSGSDNLPSGSGGITGADGRVTITLASTLAEVKTISATVNGNAVSQQPQVTFIPGPGVALNFVTQPPASVGAGQTLAPPVQVEVRDAQGNRVVGSTATVTLALQELNPSGATLGGTVSRTVSNGVASFDDLFVQKSGLGYTLLATSAGLSNAVSGGFDVTAGSPTLTTSTLDVAPSSVVADNTAQATITVTVKDSYGNPVPGQPVNISVSGSGNTLDASSGMTLSDGRFTAKLSSTMAEAKSVDATAGSLTLPTASVTFVAGPVANLTLSASSTQVQADGVDVTTLTATAEDAFFNRVPGVLVTFSSTGSNNVFSPGDGNTDANGQRITTLSSTSAGTKTLTAASGGKSGVAVVTFLRPPAQVSGLMLTSATASGCTTIQYTLTQPGSVRADVIVEYDTGGGVFKRATQAGSTNPSVQGVLGVSTSPTGVVHEFSWNSTADLPVSNASVNLRVTALVPGALPNSATLSGVAMANGLQFGAPGLMPAGTAPSLVARVDLNSDGLTDLVVGSPTSNDLQVLMGGAMGSFGAPAVVTVGVPSSALVVRDVDRDGKADVLTAGATNNNVYLLKGVGNGTFGAASVAATLQGTAAGLAVGDLNRDGKLDLVATSSAGTVEVALASALGVFGAPAVTSVGGTPGAISISDLNLDARLDLVFADASQDVKAMMGTGSGTFGAVTPLGVGANAVGLVVTDLNADSFPDVVAARGTSGTVTVMSGNGDGTFSLQQSLPTGGQPKELAVADLDGDGNRDVVVTGVGSDVLVLLGQSTGSLNTTPRVVPAGGPATGVVVLDADRSGRLDVVAARPADNGVAVLLSGQADRCEGSLNAGLQLPVSPQPAASTLADLDGDGRPDLVVAVGGAVSGAGALNVAKGLGNGMFSAFTSIPLGTGTLNPQGVTTGDFNGDGRLDLVSANSGTNTVSVLLDNGSGGYNTPSTWSTGSSPRAAAVADFDGDGKQDLAVANNNSSSVSVLYGNGDGTFSVTQSFNVGSAPRSLVVVDLNADGLPDIVTANYSGSSVSALRNKGGRTSTSFVVASTTLLGYNPPALATGDFNGDNKPDIVVVGNPGSIGVVSVLLGVGDGTLGAPITTSANISAAEFKDPRGVVVEDFDEDGIADVLVGNNADVSVIRMKGLGDGKFSIGAATGMGTGLVALVGADVDGDGHQDLVGTITADNRVVVLRSKGTSQPGATLVPVQATAGVAAARGVTLVDMNRDGKLDLLTANRASNSTSLLLGDGLGGFTLFATTALSSGTSPAYIATGDVDRNGTMDVVVANTGATSGLSVLLGDGNGGLTKVSPDLSNPVTPIAVRLEDFNGDGALDLLSNGSSVYLRLNNGSGSFGAISAVSAGGVSQSVTVADFNNDGKPDVASANLSTTTTVGVLLGTGAGTFVTPAKTLGLGGNGRAIASGDVNRDGKMDVAVIINATSGYDLKVLKGNGDGTFDATPLATFNFTSTGNTPEWLVIADMDGDGRMDVATVVYGSDAVLVWRGDGSGGFSGPLIWGTADLAQSMAVADVNGDGLPDMVVGGSSLASVVLAR